MKTKNFLYSLAFTIVPMFAFVEDGSAQTDQIAVFEEVEVTQYVPGKLHYYAEKNSDNMELSIGAGAQTFLTEHIGDAQYTLALDLALSKWITPSLGLRLNFMGGSLHPVWPRGVMNHMRYVSVYGDLMWNMFNTFAGYNEKRVFSIIPFAGIGGSYAFKNPIAGHSTYSIPVSAGIKLNFRLGHYVDLFFEGRAAFQGDAFNGVVRHAQIESIVSAVGGLTFKFGSSRFKTYDPYAERATIMNLNSKVNQLRSALDQCESRVCPPCPEVEVIETVTTPAPIIVCNPDLTAVVRFTINSSVITKEEMVNVYNIAEWMKKNSDCNVWVEGYADKNTGTAKYNMMLSNKRADAVVKVLTEKYGIDKKRIVSKGMGSDSQVYPENNNWNRVVIFKGTAKK